jgi:hypothetical protein
MRWFVALVVSVVFVGVGCGGSDSPPAPPLPPPRPAAAPGHIVTVLERPPVPAEYQGMGSRYLAVAVDHEGTMYVFGENPWEITVHPPRGRPGLLAQLVVFHSFPGVALDRRTGDLYVPGGSKHVVHRVTQKGEISVVAGSKDQPGFAGDGGPARAALLKDPRAVALDPAVVTCTSRTR